MSSISSIHRIHCWPSSEAHVCICNLLPLCMLNNSGRLCVNAHPLVVYGRRTQLPTDGFLSELDWALYSAVAIAAVNCRPLPPRTDRPRYHPC